MTARNLLWLAALLLALGAGRHGLETWVETTALPPLAHTTSTEMRARNGEMLHAFTVEDGRWRLGIGAPAAADPLYRTMLVAYEDKRFYHHSGVDPRALLRAVAQAAWHGHIVSGGSTLTMQVARLLEASGTGGWPGKLRQIRLALALERRLSKDAILTLYLDLAPMGGNLEGVRAGSLAWHGVESARLTPAQAALLVALPQSPEARRPDRAPEAARAARDRVLTRMVDAGILPPGEARAAMSEPAPRTRHPFPAHALHLATRLRAEAPQMQRHATTLDPALQRRIEALAAQAVAGNPTLSAAIVVADPATGAILSHVGAARGWVDMTRARRSPGSTLKPLIYGLAFDARIAHPESLIADRATDFDGYAPRNFDGAFRGDVRVREALMQSLNVPAVALTARLGPAALMAAMRRAGMHPVLPGDAAPGLAVALGGVGVTLEELVTLYGALARGGRELPGLSTSPASVSTGRQVLSREAAWQVGHILSGIAPPPQAPALRLAYKTGTSYGYRDAWALGYDSAHVVGIWIGRPDGTPVPGALGAGTAAPILFAAFEALGPPTPLPAPPPEVLLGTKADLPAPLRRVGGDTSEGLRLAFPPDGAEVEGAQGLALKVAGGTPPFSWLANGAPLQLGQHARETWLHAPGAGQIALTVIDATGRAARARVTLR